MRAPLHCCFGQNLVGVGQEGKALGSLLHRIDGRAVTSENLYTHGGVTLDDPQTRSRAAILTTSAIRVLRALSAGTYAPLQFTPNLFWLCLPALDVNLVSTLLEYLACFSLSSLLHVCTTFSNRPHGL